MHKSRKSSVVLVSAMVSFVLAMTPMAAQADTRGQITFTGKAVLSAPICFPTKILQRLIGPPAPACAQADPKVPVTFAFVAPNPHTSLACVGAAVHLKKTPPTSAGACGLAATGVVGPLAGAGPWCGLSSGVINAGGVIVIAGKTVTITGGTWTGVGGTLILSGTARKGNQLGSWNAVVQAAADTVKGHSCVTGATHFVVAGTATASVTGTK